MPRRPGRTPEQDPVEIEVEQARHPGGEGLGVCPFDEHPVEDVLGHVVGGVCDVGLGVDGEPRLALGGQDIAGVEIGMQEQGIAAAARQRAEQAVPSFASGALRQLRSDGFRSSYRLAQ
jgi:hypothetical protein